jgi:hypothetical protein
MLTDTLNEGIFSVYCVLCKLFPSETKFRHSHVSDVIISSYEFFMVILITFKMEDKFVLMPPNSL